MMWVWHNKLKEIIFSVVCIISVNACVMSGSKNINNYCYITKPIYISPEDVLSDSTITQLLNHNEKWQAICEER